MIAAKSESLGKRRKNNNNFQTFKTARFAFAVKN